MDIPKIIPKKLAVLSPMLTIFWEPLLAWLSQLLYERVLGRAKKHRLVSLADLLEFAEIEKACEEYHQTKGRGHPVVHTVPRMVRVLFLRWYGGYSLRETEEAVNYNLLYKWFAGYSLFAQGPNYRTIHNFEKYIIEEHERLFLDTIIRQIDKSVPGERQKTQIGDTFAMLADAALESVIERLRHSVSRLLIELEAANPAAYEQVLEELDREALWGEKKEKLECYLAKEEWMGRLRATVTGVKQLLRLLSAQKQPATVVKWVERLEKVLRDELRVIENETGEVTWIEFLSAKKRGKYAICSATDPEATIRNHGEKKKDFGYNISVATTTNFIREIQADTGSQPDAVAIPQLLEKQQEHHDLCPEKFVYDQAAGTGKTAAAVAAVTNGQTQLVVKPIPYDKRSEKLGPRDCTLAEDGLSLTCPSGEKSWRKYRSGSGAGYNFRFMPPQCGGCALLKACRGDDKEPTRKREFFLSDYYLHYLELVTYSKTEAFKKDMKLRPQVERVIAGLVLHNGARRARFRGLKKVDFQVKMCAMAYNVKRWLKVLDSSIPALLPDFYTEEPPLEPALSG